MMDEPPKKTREGDRTRKVVVGRFTIQAIETGLRMLPSSYDTFPSVLKQPSALLRETRKQWTVQTPYGIAGACDLLLESVRHPVCSKRRIYLPVSAAGPRDQYICPDDLEAYFSVSIASARRPRRVQARALYVISHHIVCGSDMREGGLLPAWLVRKSSHPVLIMPHSMCASAPRIFG
jgi:hypothetical protein